MHNILEIEKTVIALHPFNSSQTMAINVLFLGYASMVQMSQHLRAETRGGHGQPSNPNKHSIKTNPTQSRRGSQSTRLLNLAQTIALIPSPTLVQNSFPTLREDLELTALNTLQPVTEASTDTGEERVDPEGFLGEHRAHFDTELPEADGDACFGISMTSIQYLSMRAGKRGITIMGFLPHRITYRSHPRRGLCEP